MLIVAIRDHMPALQCTPLGQTLAIHATNGKNCWRKNALAYVIPVRKKKGFMKLTKERSNL